MKYILRAIRYFVMICCVVTIILAALALMKMVNPDVNSMFRNGWTSVGEILIMFAAVSAFYPKFGYTTRMTAIGGEHSENREGIIEYMTSHGYKLEKEEGENMYFRCSGILNRATRAFSDRISLTRTFGGYDLEGPARDVSRLSYGLESKFSAAADSIE